MEIIKNKNLLSLMNTICNDESLIIEFSKKESFDELYDFCLKISPGYTKEEFKEFILSLSNVINNTDPTESLKANVEINDENLKNINGGFSFEEFIKRVDRVSSIFDLGAKMGKNVRELFCSIADDIKNDNKET